MLKHIFHLQFVEFGSLCCKNLSNLFYSSSVLLMNNIMKLQTFKRSGPVACYGQGWANLDQASKHLEVFRFRDLSPTPKP